MVKVEKPAITPVPVNRDFQSEFAKEILAEKTTDIQPVFVDYDKVISKDKLQDGCNYYYIKNESNDLFSLRYILDMGSWNSLKFEPTSIRLPISRKSCINTGSIYRYRPTTNVRMLP